MVRSLPTWWDEGKEPDYRFSLANERTFLAWIRTSLSLLAAAVAIVQLVPPFHVAGARTAIGVILALAGLGSAVLAYTRWSANQRAMRNARPLPFTRALVILAFTLASVGAAVLALSLFSSR